MTTRFRLIYPLAFSLCFFNCTNNDIKNKRTVELGEPLFNDNGNAIDNLRKEYDCENIEYENWGEKKATDSCLTVCLINSTKVSTPTNIGESVSQFRAIALTIKNALAVPQAYKCYYIIFLKKENNNGLVTKSHLSGMEIKSSDL
jgi:hypothetical protein